MPKLQFWKTEAEVLDYIRNEFLATLNDDLERMEGAERQHYEDEDREEMRARIADLESIMPRLTVTP